MAENKKSFILYADQIEMWESLTDEQAGKLMKHIIKYVNDLNPVTSDPFVKLAFASIKPTLKRDLKKWDEIRLKRSEAGRLGGLKSGETRAKNEANEANASSTKQNEANEAVSVSVNVNDSVSVLSKDNNIESNKLDSTPDKPKIVIVPYQKIQKHYNDICTKLPKCTSLTDTRKKAINARYKEHGEESVFKVLTLVAKSSFLGGENDKNWKPNFDWIFKPTNFIKILEGNYNNKTSKYDWTQRKNN